MTGFRSSRALIALAAFALSACAAAATFVVTSPGRFVRGIADAIGFLEARAVKLFTEVLPDLSAWRRVVVALPPSLVALRDYCLRQNRAKQVRFYPGWRMAPST